VTVEALIDRLLASDVSSLMLTYRWAWPTAEVLHLSGLVLLVGTVSLFDLRVLGIGKGIPPAAIHRLIPFGLAGLALSILTGLAFVSGAPDQYFYNSAFHLKAAFLTVAAANAAYFYAGPFRRVRALGQADDAPRSAKAAAIVSLASMTGIMLCGRMLTFFRPPAAF